MHNLLVAFGNNLCININALFQFFYVTVLINLVCHLRFSRTQYDGGNPVIIGLQYSSVSQVGDGFWRDLIFQRISTDPEDCPDGLIRRIA